MKWCSVVGVKRLLHRDRTRLASAHLLVLLNRLLLCFGNDALQFVEAPLHFSEAQSGVLLVPPDPLQLFLAVLLGDAGALLPLLDALREDLVNAAVDEKLCLFEKKFPPQKMRFHQLYHCVFSECGDMFNKKQKKGY